MSKEKATIDNQVTCIDEKVYKSSLLSNNVKKEIQEQVFNYLTKSDLDNLPKDVKFVIRSLKNDLLDGCNENLKLEDIEIQHFIISPYAKEHKQVNFVLKIGDMIRSVTSVINKETGEIVDIENSDGTDGKGNLLLNDSMVENVIFTNTNYSGLEPIEIVDDDSNKNIYDGFIKVWNGYFKKNRKDLKGISDKGKRKEIIKTNSEEISKILKFLQGTVAQGNRPHSIIDNFVAGYFEHFLPGSPVLLDNTPLVYKRIEDGALIVKGDYKFEVLDENDEPKVINAKFAFRFEKTDGGWIGSLHSLLDTRENSKFIYNYKKGL